ncbi:MAG TPA: class I mannose-6-phosphate isomerase [Sphingomonadaceae bacterium]|nr:class I mannose-6-phosphate isomerase [Sphingomonadaceae bacterium]
MPAIRLATKRVEKPWGRHRLWPGFADAAPDTAAIGEVWFEAPADVDAVLLVKYLFTSEKLSIQVHPDDAEARARGYPRGKDEAWVVLAADPTASIAIGLRETVTKEALRAAALDGSIEQQVDWKAVRAGDVYYSPAGTVHAIGAGLTLIEVQQNVDLTYRLYDYGRGRELHLDDGIAVSNPVPYVSPYVARDVAPGRSLLAEGPAFVLERWTRGGEYRLAPAPDRPLWLVPIADSGTIDGTPFGAGGVWMVAQDAHLALAGDADLLVAYPGHEWIADLERC